MFIVLVLQFSCLFLNVIHKKLQAPGGWGGAETPARVLFCNLPIKYIKHLVSLGGVGAIPPPSERTQLLWHSEAMVCASFVAETVPNNSSKLPEDRLAFQKSCIFHWE